MLKQIGYVDGLVRRLLRVARIVTRQLTSPDIPVSNFGVVVLQHQWFFGSVALEPRDDPMPHRPADLLMMMKQYAVVNDSHIRRFHQLLPIKSRGFKHDVVGL